jgi:hypothetical protein
MSSNTLYISNKKIPLSLDFEKLEEIKTSNFIEK